ncbi:winged helix-turn-helix transcriptional regulator, partial [candidate division WOR-3 bacterium]|nr:winged helix-turn-helix transcriptional regulator [candidate division WOR-3 bacterium]
VTEKVTVKLTDNQKKIIRLMGKDSNITAEILSKKLGISVRKIRENTAKLKQKGLIKRFGSDKDGWWEVTKE